MRSNATTAPASVAQIRPLERSGSDIPPRGRTRRTAVVWTILGLFVFLLLQVLLAAYEVGVERDAIRRGTLDVYGGYRVSFASHLPFLAGGGLAYVTLAVGGSAVASRGHRLLFALPAVTYVFMPALMLDTGGFRPEPVGWEWSIDCYSNGMGCIGPWFAHPWVGAVVDLILVLTPGWILRRLVRPRRWPGRADAAALAAILTTIPLVATILWAISVIESNADERAVVTTAAFGLALGAARPWWPWLHVLFAASAAGFIGLMLDFLLWPEPGYAFADALPYSLGQTWPIVAAGLIASAWQPLAWTVRRLQERPIQLVIAVNVLNIVDAVMTLLAVRSGGAFESNPVVRFAGLPAKVVLVGLLTWLLYRRKPTALVWPFVALLCVAGYHVAGIFVNGWR